MDKNDKTIIKDILLAEFNVLRQEIQQYHNERNSYVNYTIMLSAGLVGLITANTVLKNGLTILYLIIPFLYTFLGWLFIDKSIRVLRIASYIHNSIRGKLNLISNDELLNWEVFKTKTQIFPKWISKFLDRLRIFIFIIPSIICLILFFFQAPAEISSVEYLLTVSNILLMILIVIFHFMTEETSGSKKEKVKNG